MSSSFGGSSSSEGVLLAGFMLLLLLWRACTATVLYCELGYYFLYGVLGLVGACLRFVSGFYVIEIQFFS
jgi:hypothetical protein